MSDLTFRTATLADVDRLQAFVHSAYRGDSARRGWTHEADLLDGQRTDPDALQAMLNDPTYVILLAERGEALAGCVSVTDIGKGLAYLGMLSVDPERQGEGLGRKLITAAEAEAVSRYHVRRMEMTVIVQRHELIAWYERCGYALTGETRPFPMTDPRFGLPRRDDLAFVVLARDLTV